MSESSPPDDSSSGSVSMSSPTYGASESSESNTDGRAGPPSSTPPTDSAGGATAALDSLYASLLSAYDDDAPGLPVGGDRSVSVGGDGIGGDGGTVGGSSLDASTSPRARRPNLTFGSGSDSGDTATGADAVGSLNGLLLAAAVAAGDPTNAGDLGGFDADLAPGGVLTGVAAAAFVGVVAVAFVGVVAAAFVGVDVAEEVRRSNVPTAGLFSGLGWTFAGDRAGAGGVIARRPRVSTSSSCCHSHCHDDCHSQSRASRSAIFLAAASAASSSAPTPPPTPPPPPPPPPPPLPLAGGSALR